MVVETITSEDRDKAKAMSIVEYLDSIGVDCKKSGHKYLCNSPITEEKNPSFYIYPENTFYDFSSGVGGDIITLIMHLEECSYIRAIRYLLKKDYSEFKTASGFRPPEKRLFSIRAYIKENPDVYEYIKKRKLVGSYCFSGFRIDFIEDKKVEVPSVIFPHIDESGRVCGAQFRSIYDNGFIGSSNVCHKQRFANRGKCKFHVLENITEKWNPFIYISESETTSHSLFNFLCRNNINSVVICIGGVNNVPETLPYKWEHCRNRFLVIDYDGNESLWRERCGAFEHLKSIPIRLPFDKGIDLNYLDINDDLNNIIKISNYGFIEKK